ncbi:hypothetical protein BDN70DRAFT_935258 [Pholiota conissans]|uniref:PHD-type domain-containing protein n=1 Tax=Pholiota conissans TaxID=109636 RepID=A0A9P5YV16_9AGAR|nr:hypothetical protein BDN70DRAFT_935258 [Pholiota conissans]
MKRQIATGCTLCHAPIHHETCNARTYHFKIQRDGKTYAIWDHEGFHYHDRPPFSGSLSEAEKLQVDAQVLRNPTALPHALRTGDTFPGSVPLSKISPILANPRAAQYQVSQSQTRLGISRNSTSKGQFTMIKSVFDLNQDFETPFIIDSCIHGPAFLSFQTPFMKETLENSIDSWTMEIQDEKNHLAGRHGFVTDGDHSFFREGVLNVTCVFHPLLLAWTPVLYTWILRQDIPHHRLHFRRIQQTLVKCLIRRNLKFESHYFLHVFDFSAAQRAAHAEEYVEAAISMMPGFHELLKPAQDAQPSEFTHLLHVLVDEGTSKDSFEDTVATLRADYPKISKWLDWWMRPTFRSLIFPAYRTMDPATADKIPKTSNVAEHSHSLLHHSSGSTDQDLILGVKKLYLHVREFESRYNSIKEGHFDPAPPRAYRPPTKPKYEVNDGRAPDTEAALTPAPNFDTATDNKNLLLAYQWQKPNSCFVDNGLEIWFRAYLSWPGNLRTTFLASIPSKSFLSSLFHHYERRLKHLTEGASVTAHQQNLGLMQTITLDRVFEKWKLYPNKTDFGCAKTWISHALQDGSPSTDIQEYFGIAHYILCECAAGHKTSGPASKFPEIWITINDHDMQSVHNLFGDYITTTNYFQHYVPRARGGNYSGGTTPVHLVTVGQCQDQSCPRNRYLTAITTRWPQILNINADLRADPRKIHFENTFTIPNANGDITYELVGRIIHVNGNHFVSQIRFGGQTYEYNDMKQGGQLQQSNNPHLLETYDGLESVCYIYNRSSLNNQTSRLVSEIEREYTPTSIKEDQVINLCSPAQIEKPLPPLPPIDNVGKQLDSYPEEAYILCDSCPLSKPNASQLFNEITVQCTLCEKVWHEDCVSIDGADTTLDDTWACPACINPHGGRWDKLMLQAFVLLKPTPSSHFYPAQILGRSSTTEVHVEWYEGNVYQSDDKPPEACSIFTPLECLHAKNCDEFFKYTKDNMGTIKWPIRLEEDAADLYNYTNPHIRKILESSYGAILEILLGTRDHPIVPLYKNWNASRPATVKMISRHQFGFTKCFTLDVLPGDQSLVDHFLQYLLLDIKDGSIYVSPDWVDNVASILFRLAVIRGYLGRNACDDIQIFYLAYGGLSDSNIAPDDVYFSAKTGTLKCLLTRPEQAMAASGSTQTLGIYINLGRDIDRHDMLVGKALVEAHTTEGAPYVFFNMTSEGMSGGPKFVPNRRIEPPPSLPIQSHGRIKPRPRGKPVKNIVPKGVRMITPAPGITSSKKRGHESEGTDQVAVRRSKRNKRES